MSDNFVRSTLQADILFEVVRQEVERRGLTVRPPDDAGVRAQTLARFDQTGSPDIFNAFPKRFQDRALAQTAAVVTLEDALGGGPIDDAKAKATYDADPRRFGELCVRHVLLANEDDAKRVLAELQQGADFTETVDKESTDTSSEAYGGKIVNSRRHLPAGLAVRRRLRPGGAGGHAGPAVRAGADQAGLARVRGRRPHRAALRPGAHRRGGGGRERRGRQGGARP